MEENKKNPLLEPENYLKGYEKNAEDLKNNPQLIELDRLTYEIFEGTEQGRRWLEIMKERYLIHSMANVYNLDYASFLIRKDGFQDFIRLILGMLISRKQQIAAGKN